METAQTIALYQPILYNIALRITGSNTEAEDVVQDTFLKWLTAEKAHIINTKAYLIRAVTNNCLKYLQSARLKSTEYFDGFSASDFLEKYAPTVEMPKFDFETELQEALAVLHNKLEPMEKAVFVLKEAFNLDYADIQEILDKKKDHCRQLLCRARKKLSSLYADAGGVPVAAKNKRPGFQAFVENFRKSCNVGLDPGLIDDFISAAPLDGNSGSDNTDNNLQ